jgi:hypothetical protein
MARVIASVMLEGSGKVRDFEIPSNIEIENLIDELKQFFEVDTDSNGCDFIYHLEALPLGRMLEPTESLQEAGVWDGSILIMYAVPREEAAISEEPVWEMPVTPGIDSGTQRNIRGDMFESPLTGWRSMDIREAKDILPVDEGEPQTEGISPISGWRKLDVSFTSQEKKKTAQAKTFAWKRLD